MLPDVAVASQRGLVRACQPPQRGSRDLAGHRRRRGRHAQGRCELGLARRARTSHLRPRGRGPRRPRAMRRRGCSSSDAAPRQLAGQAGSTSTRSVRAPPPASERPPPWDTLRWAPRVHLVLFVHRVRRARAGPLRVGSRTPSRCRSCSSDCATTSRGPGRRRARRPPAVPPAPTRRPARGRGTELPAGHRRRRVLQRGHARRVRARARRRTARPSTAVSSGKPARSGTCCISRPKRLARAARASAATSTMRVHDLLGIDEPSPAEPLPLHGGDCRRRRAAADRTRLRVGAKPAGLSLEPALRRARQCARSGHPERSRRVKPEA